MSVAFRRRSTDSGDDWSTPGHHNCFAELHTHDGVAGTSEGCRYDRAHDRWREIREIAATDWQGSGVFCKCPIWLAHVSPSTSAQPCKSAESGVRHAVMAFVGTW